MLKVENIEVFNFEGALRGMRNPMNSWDKSDSKYVDNKYVIGPNDLKLAQTLIRGGAEECKFLRQIGVSMDISAPRFWWTEMDTYKVGTTANSCSTMHKLTSREFATQDFSFKDFINDFDEKDRKLISDIRVNTINYCEKLRQLYIKTKDKRIWRALVEILPNSYMQKRTWTANYQVLRNIYFQRRSHKLQEWRDFCKRIESLPYAKELICYKNKVE